MKNYVELLAPAGDYQSLIAAVQNGVDAVYLGGSKFNARHNAKNFDQEELVKAIEYAHIRGVKVYLTLNTLLLNKEFEELSKYLIFVYNSGIDGLIVQDLGVASFAKKLIPGIKLHASTQMTVHNLDGVLELEKLGFERAVLSRELSINEIKYICSNCNIEIEIFIHGALCASYSGQCLMSSFIGGRSGNRGLCAQPCRLPYTITSGHTSQQGYILSPKDLCSINYIDEIINAGVKSLKIEGRMKKPEYVAIITSKYRKHIDRFLKGKGSEIAKEDYEDMLQIFNRGGFSSNYLIGEKPEVSIEKPNNWGIKMGVTTNYDKANNIVYLKLGSKLSVGDNIEFWDKDYYGINVTAILKNNVNVQNANPGETVGIPIKTAVKSNIDVYKTSSIELLEKAKKSFQNENIKIDLTGSFVGKYNAPITFKVTDDRGNKVVCESDYTIEKAINRTTTVEIIREQISKLGNTPYQFRELTINIDDCINIPIVEINKIRRDAIDKINRLRLGNKEIVVCDNSDSTDLKLANRSNDTKISIYLNNLNQFDTNLKVDRLYIPLSLYIKDKQKTLNFIKKYKETTKVYISLPRILRDKLKIDVKKHLEELYKEVDGILFSNISQVKYIKEGIKTSVDMSFNIFNNYSINAVKELGIDCLTLSPELNIGQIKDIISKTNNCIELVAYGNIPVMITEICPQKSMLKQQCDNCKDEYSIIDRQNNKFRIIRDNVFCNTEILNTDVLFLGEELKKLLALKPDYIRLVFTDQSLEDINQTIKFHRDYIDFGEKIIYDYKGYINKMKHNFTKGHYFRGVE